MAPPIYCALVHYPVRDREGQAVTTAVTNLDIHDIARTARTYGLKGYYIVTPIEAQRVLVLKVLEHWDVGPGRKRVPERSEALSLCNVVTGVEDAMSDIQAREGTAPVVVATGARSVSHRRLSSYTKEAQRLREDTTPTLLLFGTGHGLYEALVERADILLAPIRAQGDFNHLSVRAAAAIVLDRLLGDEN